MESIELNSLYTKSKIFIPKQKEYEEYEIGDTLIYIDESEEEEHEEPAVVEKKGINIEDKDELKYSIKIVRRATEHDMQMFDSYQRQTEDGMNIFKDLIKKYNLPMHPIACTYSLKGNRAYFLFTAGERVDFRDLVKELAKLTKKKIYLRQIGPRDRAKIVGGYGKCGQQCCCKRFLRKLKGVTMETARVQGVAGKGSSKLLGCCGKLLCCLNYEDCFYQKQSDKMPDEGQKIKVIKTKESAQVINCDYINETIRVITEKGKVETFALDEVSFKKNKPVKKVSKNDDQDDDVSEEDLDQKAVNN